MAASERIGDLPVVDRKVQQVLALYRDEDSSTNELILAMQYDAPNSRRTYWASPTLPTRRPVRVRTIR